MIGQILEAVMLICFGLSWPMNAYKNYKAQTAAGTSWQFLGLITLGYFAGIAAKFFTGTINWVLVVYFLNVACLGINWAIYFRNRKLDKQREEIVKIEDEMLETAENILLC
jgi:membrane protein DedA with SNARE-associated domain